MAVNTAALKSFAPAMRRQLLEAVGRKLDLLLNSQTPDTLSTYATQIAELREQEAENREQLLERVAYTWFNRLCALRYLDARGWHPFGCKVLMPAAEGETQPELLKLTRAGSLPAELKPHTNEARLHGLLDGQIPPAIAGADPQGEVYRELVLASCRSYHQLLPELFEGLDDASELLLPNDLLSEGSIAGGFRSAISDEDCEDVEIIGWLYQFYISEKKEQVIGKVVNSEDIPAATQLFTPNWIVKYMVQNTIGAQWLATYPDSTLREQMEFYIEPAEQTEEVKAKLAEITPTSLNPEELTLIDPACGSGHILVEAYEIFKAIYLERGYQIREIPQLVFEKNLFGLDIDERAAQLSSFCLLMKGRSDDRRLFERGVKLNVMELKDSTDFDPEGFSQQIKLSDHGLQLKDLTELKRLFENATTFGSLIQVPERLAEKLQALKQLTKTSRQGLFVAKELERLEKLVRQAEMLAERYDAVVMNPPYMGRKYLNPVLRKFATSHYESGQADLYAMFIERNFSFCRKGHNVAMICMDSWLSGEDFQETRRSFVKQGAFVSMCHLGPHAFPEITGEVVQVASFVSSVGVASSYKCTFIDLVDEKNSFLKKQRLLSGDGRSIVATSAFADVPRGVFTAYRASPSVLAVFAESVPLKVIAEAFTGLQTGDNPRFIRYWFELPFHLVAFGHGTHDEAESSGKKWFPYVKGSDYRKWYGNQSCVVDWEEGGNEIRNHPSARPQNADKYFRTGIAYNNIAKRFSARHVDSGFVFDQKNSMFFAETPEDLTLTLGLLNSDAVDPFLRILSPKDFGPGALKIMPVPKTHLKKRDIGDTVNRLIESHRHDWDSTERSWGFQFLPLLSAGSGPKPTLESSYNNWISKNKKIINEIKALEEENNRLFIAAYGLTDELSPDVPIEQITLTVNPAYRYSGDGGEEEKWDRFQRDSMLELLSYATGCMMGRYSLDQPGLILADSRESQAAQLAAYEQTVGKPLTEVKFKPDPDGIIPVLDGEWFEDDIVARTREFLAVTFPESSAGENLRFIEDALGKDIRKYFYSEFYKDHLQTYKRRPIYWMVQSPKKGFACLIYLHRYTKDTLNQVLNNYFRPYLQKLEARLAQLGLDQLNDDLPARERTSARKEAEKITKVLKECQAWEQDALLPLAQQRIELDLDDGVKVNYLKLQDVLAVIPGLAAKED